MAFELRLYQREACDAVWESLRAGNSPCVQLPTGVGKSLCIADFAHRIRERGGRVWILTHVKELIVQNRRTLKDYTGLDGVGTLCSGLNEKKQGRHITFATIQSIYRPALAGKLEPPDVIVIDEAHRIPPGKDGKFYNQVLLAFPDARRVGFTATPWRMDNGLIYGDREGVWFNDLAYSKSVPEMVELGYLCPLVGVETEVQLDLKGVGKTAGDYKQSQVAERESNMWLKAMVENVKRLAENRNHIAVYCPTVEAANRTAKAFAEGGWSASVVTGETEDRAEVIDVWKAKGTRVLCSVEVLTTGFDHPALDCLVILRPTESSSLWVQILGRGTRIFDGKKNCLVLDYAGNLARLGGIGMMEDFVVERKGKVVATKKAVGDKKRLEKKKSNKLEANDPMAGRAGAIAVRVIHTSYVVIGSKSQPGKSMVMVCYDCETEQGYTIAVNDFVCCEYSGYARHKAESWAARRGGTYLPRRAHEALSFCYSLPSPRSLMVKRNGKFWNVEKEIM